MPCTSWLILRLGEEWGQVRNGLSVWACIHPGATTVFKQGPDLVRSDSSHSGAQGQTSHGVAIKALDSGAWVGVGGGVGLE